MKAARLGDVTESMKNGLYKHASQYGEDGLPCLRMYNIDVGGIVWRDIKRMRVSDEEREDYELRAGDLLVNRVNSRELVGKTAVIPLNMEPSVFESKNIRLRLKADRARPKFINYQLLAGGRRYFAGNAQQVVGMASVSQTQLADFPIVLTDLVTQDRIVAEIEKQFSRLDEAVANLKRVKANLKRYTATVLKAAVEGCLVSTEAELARREGRNYETGAQLLQRILETRRIHWQGKGKYREPSRLDATRLPSLPEGWVSSSLEALLREPLRNGHSAKATDAAHGLRAFTLSAVTEGDFSEVNTKLTVAVAEKVADLWAKPGDIYVERSNTPELVGTARLYRGPANFAFIPDLLIRVRVCDRALPEYLEFVLQSASGRRYFKSCAQGISGTMPKIDQAAIEAFAVPLPPFAEQGRIVSEVERRLSLVRGVEAEVNSNLKRAERLRQGVLKTAFGGTTPGIESLQDESESKESTDVSA